MGAKKLYDENIQEIAEIIALKKQKETENKIKKKIDSLYNEVKDIQNKLEEAVNLLNSKMVKVEKQLGKQSET